MPAQRKNSRWQRIRYYIPATAWIPEYTLALLGGDVLGGVTVACMLIPQSVSYASSLAKLSPVTGLFSAAIPGIVYALLGTSRQLNVAPEAALSLLLGQAVSDILHGDPHSHPVDPEAIGLEVATIITFQAGLISFLLGIFRLGFLDVVLSRALLRGFVTAVAVVIMIEQLIPMFGLTTLQHQLNPQTTLEKFVFLVDNVFAHMHKTTTLISFVALLVLVVLRNVKAAFKQYVWIYRLPEVLLVVVISTHSIVSAKQNAAKYGHSISPNRELVALGAGNIVASFVPGTLPAGGSITR
ncbi:hypothetical protein EIP86_002412 [Pleurotus ostreatoroseus]|nr:hypothetical protein EIP86_002412 [Pleurotus ostreatoroseus]